MADHHWAHSDPTSRAVLAGQINRLNTERAIVRVRIEAAAEAGVATHLLEQRLMVIAERIRVLRMAFDR
jgi:hypothetical protein